MRRNTKAQSVMHISLIVFSFYSFFLLSSVSALSSVIAPATPTKIAVAGATGRTGSIVVEELLKREGITNVVALVRNLDKAQSCLPTDNEKLSIVKCDLGNEEDIFECLQDCDAAVWAATGFSDNPDNTWVEKMQKLLGMALTPKQTIDYVGVPAFGKYFSGIENNEDGYDFPRVVMLSSAGVTRIEWDQSKKDRLIGASDIPIVRLNPLNILNIKAESEDRLRKSGAKYCIYRPCGLNDDWPSGLRPIISQGDVAVGRINRKDAAKILVDCIFSTESEGKTFESVTIDGYLPAESLSKVLSSLQKDSDGALCENVVTANYLLMQQLLPGEKQDSASLAMGQSYEQLDNNEEGRFGERGSEDAVRALQGNL